MSLKTSIYRPYDVKECALRTVLSAGEGFAESLPNRYGRREVSPLVLFIKVPQDHIIQVGSFDLITGSDADVTAALPINHCLLIHSVDHAKDVIAAGGDLKDRRNLANLPDIIAVWFTATIFDWCAELVELLRSNGKVIISRSRSAQKRENDRKFFHGIDYTRFQRSAQGGAA
ncbi:hypothetical protein [Sulfitobacter sp. R18_1]|uniref:hypothetical protein n=1 Tax=Sulfitobacter sp. R18_1 TaxID=2821104 RepID=UPI001ADA8DC7|nr:hypothetical protein [Sulfitobacter sp. R18_1]MBO9430588.1 hypothetical protein [Sulfitobacter sp. R18_1]